MGGSGASVDAENDDGGKRGRASGGAKEGGGCGLVWGGYEGKQGELSSLHGHHLWAFFTAGEQMKWNQM